jgi:hypothetical protein
VKSVTKKKPAGYWEIPFNSHTDPQKYFAALRLCKKYNCKYPEALKRSQSAPVIQPQATTQKPVDLPKEPAPLPVKVAFKKDDVVHQARADRGTKALYKNGRVISQAGDIVTVQSSTGDVLKLPAECLELA